MRKVLLGIAVVAVVAPNSASAADLSRPVYKAPPPVAVAWNWTGCYIGGNVGGKWGRADDHWVASPGHDLFGGVVSPIFSATGSTQLSGSSFLGGGQIGCNYQTSSVVWGIEGDFDWVDLNGSRDLRAIAPGTVGQAYHNDFSERWLSTLRGRVGYAWDRWLLYLTGGLAVARISYTDSLRFLGFGTFDAGSATEVRVGGTVGAGVEARLWDNHWTAKVEYLYVDISGPNFTQLNPAFAPDFIDTTHHLREHVVRVGLNYKFDWGVSQY